jgi:hypothetical protein
MASTKNSGGSIAEEFESWQHVDWVMTHWHFCSACACQTRIRDHCSTARVYRRKKWRISVMKKSEVRWMDYSWSSDRCDDKSCYPRSLTIRTSFALHQNERHHLSMQRCATADDILFPSSQIESVPILSVPTSVLTCASIVRSVECYLI